MARGSKSKYTSKQKRTARHIEDSAKKSGKSSKTAARIAYATVNKQDHGGKKSGSGRGKKSNHSASRAGGKHSHSGSAYTKSGARKKSSSSRGGSRAAHARAGRASHRT